MSTTIVVALPGEAPEALVLETPAPQMVVGAPPTPAVTIVTGLQGPPGPAGSGADVDLSTTKGWAFYGDDPAVTRPESYGSVEWAGDGDVLPENAELYDTFVDTGGEAGLLLRKQAFDNIGGHRVVALRSDGKVEYADNLTPGHAGRVLGITTASVLEDDFVIIAGQEREVSDPSWTWTLNAQLYLDTAGNLTESAPGSGFVLPVAVALSATRLRVRVGFPLSASTMPAGGVAGAYLAKASAADFDAEWRTEIKAPILIDAGLL